MSAQPEEVVLLTEWEYRLIDDLLAALEAADPAKGLVPSQAAIAARCRQQDARRLLAWLVDHQMAHSTGNGRLTHYYPGRAG